MNTHKDTQLENILICFLFYAVISIPVYSLTKTILHLMMVWNSFLAILPLVFAKLLEKDFENKNIVKKTSLSFLWLLFFPNAPYMLTDFIHISGIKYYSMETKYLKVYSTNIVSWIQIAHIGLGVLLGTLSGLLSLYIIHQLLVKKEGKIFADLMLIIICIISGYGIYIGRFLRFNSWDLVKPVSLAKNLMRNTHLFSVKFSIIFSIYILGSYLIFYAIYHDRKSIV